MQTKWCFPMLQNLWDRNQGNAMQFRLHCLCGDTPDFEPGCRRPGTQSPGAVCSPRAHVCGHCAKSFTSTVVSMLTTPWNRSYRHPQFTGAKTEVQGRQLVGLAWFKDARSEHTLCCPGTSWDDQHSGHTSHEKSPTGSSVITCVMASTTGSGKGPLLPIQVMQP